MDRRLFLRSAVAAGLSAPAFVRASSIMPVHAKRRTVKPESSFIDFVSLHNGIYTVTSVVVSHHRVYLGSEARGYRLLYETAPLVSSNGR